MSDASTTDRDDTMALGHESGIVACASYVQGRRAGDVALDQIDQALSRDDGFVWLGLYEPSEAILATVQRQFVLHDLAVEDAARAHQRPKLEQYEDSLFVVIRTAELADHAGADDAPKLTFGETHVFVGRNSVVTVRHGTHRSHQELRARCEASPQLLVQGPGFVLYALMDFLVDQYFPVVASFEEDVAEVEEQLFTSGGQTVSRDTVARIYSLKRDLLAVKRAVAPLIDVCNRLMRFDLELIPVETRPYFRDVYDHAIRINEMVDNLRELLTTAFEVNLSLISAELNEEMRRVAISSAEENRTTRRLAAWAAMIAVPTMIAGIYGMNFEQIPELRWEFGYPFALTVMIVACGVLYAGFRRSGWL